MKGGRDKRSVRVEFVLTEAEAALIKERMAELGITNLSAISAKWRWTVTSFTWIWATFRK